MDAMKINQTQLAKSMSISRVTVAELRSRETIDPKYLHMISSVTGVDLEYFENGGPVENYANASLSRMREQLEACRLERDKLADLVDVLKDQLKVNQTRLNELGSKRQ